MPLKRPMLAIRSLLTVVLTSTIRLWMPKDCHKCLATQEEGTWDRNRKVSKTTTPRSIERTTLTKLTKNITKYPTSIKPRIVSRAGTLQPCSIRPLRSSLDPRRCTLPLPSASCPRAKFRLASSRIGLQWQRELSVDWTPGPPTSLPFTRMARWVTSVTQSVMSSTLCKRWTNMVAPTPSKIPLRAASWTSNQTSMVSTLLARIASSIRTSWVSMEF